MNTRYSARSIESWPGAYESFFSSGRATALYQTIDVLQPYMQGAESCYAVFDIVDGALRTGQVLGQTFETIQRDFPSSVAIRYDALADQAVLARGLFDTVQQNPGRTSWFSFDSRRYYEQLLPAATTVVVLDTHGGKPREVDYPSTFGKKTTSRVAWIGIHRCPETVSQTIAAYFDVIKYADQIVRFQEEALYEYAATLVNVVTSREVTNESIALQDITGPLRSFCTGDSLWEIEVATRVRYHDPARPAAFKNPVVWRFVTKDGKHWKQGPTIFDLRVETLDSFFQL